MNLDNSTEPVMSVATITAAVAAVIALVTAFGLDLSQDQVTALLGVVAVVAPLIVIYARNFTVPVEKIDSAGKVKAQYVDNL